LTAAHASVAERVLVQDLAAEELPPVNLGQPGSGSSDRRL
jgi:hypothetical protein